MGRKFEPGVGPDAEQPDIRLPRAPLKRALKGTSSDGVGQVSHDAVVELRGVLEALARDVAERAVEEFIKLNEARRKQGLDERKRLNALAVSRAVENVLNDVAISNAGSQSEAAVSPGGENMSGQTHTAKPDTATDDHREVA